MIPDLLDSLQPKTHFPVKQDLPQGQPLSLFREKSSIRLQAPGINRLGCRNDPKPHANAPALISQRAPIKTFGRPHSDLSGRGDETQAFSRQPSDYQDRMFWNRDKSQERFYLLPGQGGSGLRRKRKIILIWSIIAGLIVSGFLAAGLYYMSTIRH